MEAQYGDPKLRSWTFQISNIQSIKLEDIQNPQTRLKKEEEITTIKRPTQEGMTIIKEVSPAFWTAGNPPTSWRLPSSDPTALLPLVSDQEIAENLNRRLAGGSTDLRVVPGLLDYFFRIANFGNVSRPRRGVDGAVEWPMPDRDPIGPRRLMVGWPH